MTLCSLKELLAKILSTPLVIETGTSGIWTWRKWSDGTMEMWGYQSCSSATYSANGGYQWYGGYFPVAFSSTPTLTVSGGIDGVVRTHIGYTYADASTYHTYLINWDTSAITREGWLRWYAIGTWK